jgi:hypothetical protein
MEMRYYDRIYLQCGTQRCSQQLLKVPSASKQAFLIKWDIMRCLLHAGDLLKVIFQKKQIFYCIYPIDDNDDLLNYTNDVNIICLDEYCCDLFVVFANVCPR